MPKEIMNVKEVAGYLKFGETKVYSLIEQGEIPVVKIGGQYRFLTSTIDEWLLERQKRPERPERKRTFDLARVKETKGPLAKRLLFVGMLTKALERKNVKPIIVGGNAVEFYTAGGYATGDIDLVSPSEPLDEILTEWEFKKEGRHWLNEELDILVEAPTSTLAGDYEKLTEVEIEGLKVYLLGIEDIIIDRLNAFVHWKSQDDKFWAKELISLHQDEIDWSYLEKRADKEQTTKALGNIQKELEIK